MEVIPSNQKQAQDSEENKDHQPNRLASTRIALFEQASKQASTFLLRPIWAQSGNDSLTMHDFINQPIK